MSIIGALDGMGGGGVGAKRNPFFDHSCAVGTLHKKHFNCKLKFLDRRETGSQFMLYRL